ncbi:hypothetical protein GS534_24215 [Rhodococcus hoagii]|nr:hypothetical protein [Prescottella equi]MBM4617978.1 hypothetical protein [Prescottella equi]MBM4618350.1 hypothetical protein [Prescottella equi]MBM4618362.1 hypothetical protein [Prescottella equi]MBM4618369.1 hypothetical protein [Prescottella equi]
MSELDPLETMFLIVLGLSGFLQIATGARPGSVDTLMPNAFRVLWLIMLTLGCVVALVGVFYPKDKPTGLLIESVGLAGVGVAVIIYGLAQLVATIAVYDNPGSAILTGPMTLTLGIAFWWKHRRLQQVIERLKQL